MDDRVASTLSGRIAQGLVVEDEAPAFDDREEQEEEERRHERELRERLPDRATAGAAHAHAAVHGSSRSVMAKMLERWKVSESGIPYRVPKTSRLNGISRLKS